MDYSVIGCSGNDIEANWHALTKKLHDVAEDFTPQRKSRFETIGQ